MLDHLRELVVALSLAYSLSRAICDTRNRQIKEAESTVRLVGAGVQNYEKTVAVKESKLSMLGQKLTQQQRLMEQYSEMLAVANEAR